MARVHPTPIKPGAAGGAASKEDHEADSILKRARLSTAGGKDPKQIVGGQTQRFIVPSSVAAAQKAGDKSAPTAASIAKKALELDDIKAVEAIVKSMNIKISDPEAQVRGIAALGHLAATGNQVQIKKQGQAHQYMHDFDVISSEGLFIQQTGAIGAVLRAITAHTGKRRLVLRGVWALEHMTEPVENRRYFMLLGGGATLATLCALYAADEDIMKSVRSLQASARTGRTFNSMQCCCVPS